MRKSFLIPWITINNKLVKPHFLNPILETYDNKNNFSKFGKFPITQNLSVTSHKRPAILLCFACNGIVAPPSMKTRRLTPSL